MSQVTWKVEGMSCGHCKAAIEKAVANEKATAEVSLADKQVTITYDESVVSLDKVREAIEDQGYDIV
ncbi:cation transporter [Paenibacillus sp. SC116]|uniref:cation transporter n=1 Tax=Paenibacillus sp. SC116 TaxID=2968986 RepID=UPI00215B7401|nr:cation transporter [Paenibacillus sp. SC116]MCR8845542.1 cation transporter [Paenibacillus sp. SC116]